MLPFTYHGVRCKCSSLAKRFLGVSVESVRACNSEEVRITYGTDHGEEFMPKVILQLSDFTVDAIFIFMASSSPRPLPLPCLACEVNVRFGQLWHLAP